jgi:hypothetical protein
MTSVSSHVPLGWLRNAAATRDRAARLSTSPKGWNGTLWPSPPARVGDRVSQGSRAADPGYRATWWLGLPLGGLHGTVALPVLGPLLTGVHPAWHRSRPGQPRPRWLEPPGLLGSNYGPDGRHGGVNR